VASSARATCPRRKIIKHMGLKLRFSPLLKTPVYAYSTEGFNPHVP
jgi:hypothetical protein